MQNVKTRDFIKAAKKKGFRAISQRGSHLKFEKDTQSFSVPVVNKEINGPLAQRLRKEFCF